MRCEYVDMYLFCGYIYIAHIVDIVNIEIDNNVNVCPSIPNIFKYTQLGYRTYIPFYEM